MLAFNFKIFDCLLHNFRSRYYVTDEINNNVRLWKSTCRPIITWTHGLSKEQRFICPVYPEQPVKIQTDLFQCVNQWVYFSPIYPQNRSTLTRQSVQHSRWRSELQQFNSTFQWISFDNQAICSQHGSFKASKWIFHSKQWIWSRIYFDSNAKPSCICSTLRQCHTLY